MSECSLHSTNVIMFFLCYNPQWIMKLQHKVQVYTNLCMVWSQPVCTTSSSDPSTHPSCTLTWPQGCSGPFESTILFFLSGMTFRSFPNSSLSFKPDFRCPSQKISPDFRRQGSRKWENKFVVGSQLVCGDLLQWPYGNQA